MLKENRLIYQVPNKGKAIVQKELESYQKFHPKTVPNAPAGQTLPPSPGQKTIQPPTPTTPLTGDSAPNVPKPATMGTPVDPIKQEAFKKAYESGASTIEIGGKTYSRTSPVVNRALTNPETVAGLLGVTPKPETDRVIDETIETITPTEAVTPPEGTVPTDTGEIKPDEAITDYEATMGELKDTYKESQDVITKSAEDKYNAQMNAYNESLALQQQLAGQQQALLAEGAEIQKQEAKNAYAKQEAITLQKKKEVAEAYEQMQEEQKLLNTQRQVREETSLGLIYGGFGSVAANKNLEETVVRGERELMRLSKEAVNKDTEFQNQVIELNKAYELDARKIEQWKGEESNKIYASLSQYVQEIKNNKAMSAVERSSAINQAVADYNVKVAEISASVAQTKYDLSIELMNRADRLKQQDFQNQITKAAEAREVETFEYNQKRTVINNARTDLDLLLTNYFTEDYATLPPDVLASIDRLEREAGLPTGASQQLMKMAKENEIKQGDVIKEFTNELTGEVSVVKYNFGTGKVETMKLGALEAPKSQWSMERNPNTGLPEFYNSQTNQFMSNSPFTGTLPAVFSEGQVGGWCGVYASKISTAPQVGNSWAKKKSKITHWDNPGIGDKIVLPSGVQTDGSGYGHVAVVIGFNPTTGIIDVVESNRDGRQNRGEGQGIVTKGTYNIKDIINQGGGFVAGSLKEPYHSALMGASGATESSDIDYYTELAKTDRGEALRQLKDAISLGQLPKEALMQYDIAIGSPQEGSAPEWMQDLPIVGDVFKDIKTQEPSIVEQEQKSKGGSKFEDL